MAVAEVVGMVVAAMVETVAAVVDMAVVAMEVIANFALVILITSL